MDSAFENWLSRHAGELASEMLEQSEQQPTYIEWIFSRKGEGPQKRATAETSASHGRTHQVTALCSFRRPLTRITTIDSGRMACTVQSQLVELLDLGNRESVRASTPKAIRPDTCPTVMEAIT